MDEEDGGRLPKLAKARLIVDNALLEWQLHKAGYNYLTIPMLTLMEIERISIGAMREADIIEKESKKNHNSLSTR